MTDQQERPIERGAAEDNAGAPLTETDVELSERAPSEPAERAVPGDDDGGSGRTDNA
ncbi:hypothetical protein [Actinoplanes auranticolor]|uniref:Uncharacterized protein n=1 Tax=Actinoplanes auranticolor TaxID=47988 RepID=A0A919SED1_9ACTN|nr:hypothetical protein [Actinoplanes auranticolor]GIM70220.1 hypothetical protein Aau02nite_39980 [Actinoplanes auranticolor]